MCVCLVLSHSTRFQSTLPRRERPFAACTPTFKPRVFQSTLPRRERPPLIPAIAVFGSFQSTLPRRERLCLRLFQPVIRHFNPRSREGSDVGEWCLIMAGVFQSTLPRRERPGTYIPGNSACHFNPRSREGSDNPTSDDAPTFEEFQSTLPRRERHVAGFPRRYG